MVKAKRAIFRVPQCHHLQRSDISFAAALLAGAAFLRLHRWLLPVSDPDVGSYLHVAIAWLHGALPYLDAWEYKPPGLFAVYAASLATSGGRPTIAVQSLATLATWATALALLALGPLVDRRGGTISGRYAAIFFVLLSTENEGYLGDAEVLIAPLVAWSLFFALQRPRTAWRTVAVGLLCGAALQMKLTALPMLAPAYAVLLSAAQRPMRTCALVVVVTLAPFGIEALLYAHAGAFLAFWDANVSATLRRAFSLRRGVHVENLGWIVQQVRVLAPAIEMVPFAVLLRRRGTPAFAAAWGWLGSAIVAVAAAGEFYDRHFVLVEAPVALLGGIGLRIILERTRARRLVAAVVFVATFGLHAYWETAQAAGLLAHRVMLGQHAWREPEYDRVVAVLRRLDAGRSLYLVQLTPLLYNALGSNAPTRFADSDLLLDDDMAAMIGLRGESELKRIIDGKPRYVAVGGALLESRFDRRTVAFLRRALRANYRVRARVGDTVVYQLRTGCHGHTAACPDGVSSEPTR